MILNIIKRVMKKKNINQTELAKKLGVNPSQVSLWKNGILNIPKKHETKLRKMDN